MNMERPQTISFLDHSVKPTQAVVLAAGVARRMRPLSLATPKPLLEIDGRSIIERIVASLLKNGIDRILIVTGYRDRQLVEHLDSRFPGTPIGYLHNADHERTNNIVSLHLAVESLSLDGDLLIIEADLLYDDEVLPLLLQAPHANAALVDRYGPGMDGTVVTVEDGRITGVIPPHQQGANFDFSDKFKTLNIYRFSREFVDSHFRRLLAFYAGTIAQSYYELILGIVVYLGTQKVHAVPVEGRRWAEVDDPNDLALASFRFADNSQAQLDGVHGGLWNYPLTDFCFLRNMHFPTPAMVSELKANLENTLMNYGSSQAVLNQKAAWFLECRAERLTVLNGLSQVYPWLARRFESRRALIPDPTFGEYPRWFPAANTYPALDDIDVDRIAAAGEDLIVLVNPNNPSGAVIDPRWILEQARARPQTTYLVDESFIDFSGHPSLLPALEQDPLDNVVLLKSLSKCLGVPGLRLGFVYCSDPQLVRFLAEQLPIWNLNAMAEHFLEILLKHKPALEQSYQRSRSDREAFASTLSALQGVDRIVPSAANFLLLRARAELDSESEILRQLLNCHAIHVRGLGRRVGDGRAWFRIAVRSSVENARFARAFDESLNLAARDG